MHSITIVLHKTSFWNHIKMPAFLKDFILYFFLKCLFVGEHCENRVPAVTYTAGSSVYDVGGLWDVEY